MPQPPQKELENKVWYRILKVLSIIIVVFLFVVSLSAGYSVYEDTKPHEILEDRIVFCDNGKSYKLKDIIGFNTTRLAIYSENQVKRVCYGISKDSGKTPVAENYSISSPDYIIKGNELIAVFYGFVGFTLFIVIGFLILWLIKKSFIYIIYGKKK